MKPRARLPIVIVALLAGCSDPPREAPRLSEPTDAFSPRDPTRKGAYPPTIYHRRDPSRVFTTRLRPTDLKGGFPTAYLRDITHFDQPWAKTIWDKVTAGLSLADLSPLAVEKTTPWRHDIAPDDLLLEMGGPAPVAPIRPPYGRVSLGAAWDGATGSTSFVIGG